MDPMELLSIMTDEQRMAFAQRAHDKLTAQNAEGGTDSTDAESPAAQAPVPASTAIAPKVPAVVIDADEEEAKAPPKPVAKKLLKRVELGQLLTWHEYFKHAVASGGRLARREELEKDGIQHGDWPSWVPVERKDQKVNDWVMVGTHPDIPTYASYIDRWGPPAWGLKRTFNTERTRTYYALGVDLGPGQGLPPDLREDPFEFWGKITEPMHVEFTIPGYTGVKKAIFMPQGDLGTQDMASRALAHWRLAQPNLLLEIADNGIHPKNFLSDAMVDASDDFKGFASIYKTPQLQQSKGEPEAQARLSKPAEVCLMQCSDPHVVRFECVDQLQGACGPVLLRLASHPGCVLAAAKDSRQYGPWNVRTVMVCPEDAPLEGCVVVEASYDPEDKFIVWSDPDVGKKRVLDLDGWATSAGTGLCWLHGTDRDDKPNECTFHHGGGRSFFLNSDGSISPLNARRMCLSARMGGAWAKHAEEYGRMGVLNQVLFDRLQRMMSAIATALDSSNSWFFTQAGVFVQGTHLLIENALKLSKASPNILVVDDPFPSRNSSEIHTRNDYTFAMAEFYDRNLSAALFAARKPLKTTFGDPIELDPGSSPLLSLPPGRVVQDIGALEPRFCWAAGTHFLFAPDCKAFNPLHYSPMPPGLLACGGETRETSKQILTAMESQRPAIIVKHTWAVADEFAAMLDNLVPTSHPQFERAVADLWQRMHASSRTGTAICTLSDAFSVMELNRVYPTLFKETCVVVNPMRDTPRQVLENISRCFHSNGAAEASAGNSDKAVVAGAWQMHRVMTQNLQSQANNDNRIMLCSLSLSVLAIVFSIGVPLLEEHDDAWRLGLHKNPKSLQALEALVIVIPALGTLCNSLMLSQNFHIKHAQLNFAQATVVSEIYKFRSRVGRYTMTAFKRGSGTSRAGETLIFTGELQDNDNAAVVGKMVRNTFAETLRAVTSQVQTGEMGFLGLEPVTTPQGQQEDVEVGLTKFDLEKHVQATLYSNPTSQTGPYSPLLEIEAEQRHGGSDFIAAEFPDGIEWSEPADSPQPPLGTYAASMTPSFAEDDFFGDVTPEAYVAYRLVPLLRSLRQSARTLALKYQFLQCLLLLAGALATLAAAYRLKALVPVSVAVGTALSSAMDYFRFKARLLATNKAIGDLVGLLTFWNSLGIVEKRVHSTRDRIVTTTEDAALSVVIAASGVMHNHVSKDTPKHEEKSEDKGNGAR